MLIDLMLMRTINRASIKRSMMQPSVNEFSPVRSSYVLFWTDDLHQIGNKIETGNANGNDLSDQYISTIWLWVSQPNEICFKQSVIDNSLTMVATVEMCILRSVNEQFQLTNTMETLSAKNQYLMWPISLCALVSFLFAAYCPPIWTEILHHFLYAHLVASFLRSKKCEPLQNSYTTSCFYPVEFSVLAGFTWQFTQW